MPTYANHAEEIAAALRANAANPCDPHARTLAGQPTMPAAQHDGPGPWPTKNVPCAVDYCAPTAQPAPDLHFAKSVLALHFTRLYRLFGQEFGTEEADEIRAAVDAIVAEAVQLSRVKPNVSPYSVAQHIDRDALALALESSVAKRIDLTDLAAVMMPLVLPEIERQARAVVAAERAASTTTCAPDGRGVTNTMKWIKHTDIVGMVYISNCEFCGEHHPRRAVYSDGQRYYAFCPQNGGRQMDLQDYEPVLSVATAPTPPAFDSADAVEQRTDYRAAVERAETALGQVQPAPAQSYRGADTNGCGHPAEKPAPTMRNYE